MKFGSIIKNKNIINDYKNKPHIKTVITIYSPIEKDDELYYNLNLNLSSIEPTMAGLNQNVEDLISETFDADIASISSDVINIFK